MERSTSSESRPIPHNDGVVVGSAPAESNSSGVSWSAVFAGAAVTASLSLILLALGTGLGLSSVSLWSNTGASASAIAVSAIIWLIVMEIISSSMGGYLAGRLRTKWASIHTDEVYFRDTAHGFLAWSVALIVTAAFLGSAGTSLMGHSMTTEVGGSASSARSQGNASDPNAYFTDLLFRATDGSRGEANNASAQSEAGIILTRALSAGSLSKADQEYLAQLVASRTGLNQSDAAKRVEDDFAMSQQAADAGRKTVAHSLLWAFISLLIGAFCASFASTIGGRQRDRVVTLS